MNRRAFLKAGATLGVLAVVPVKPARGKTPWGSYAEVYNEANEFVGRVGIALVDRPGGFTMNFCFHAVRAERVASVKVHLTRWEVWKRGLMRANNWPELSEREMDPIQVMNGDMIKFAYSIVINES